jgi:hypothetical protein
MPLRFPERGAAALEQRLRLRECVGKLAIAIANGECTPQLIELQALVEICEARELPIEAARIRRWIAGGRT